MLQPDSTPKVFVSYSWSSEGHKNRIREWADRLIHDGVKVIIDIYDLKEGQDKNSFMEQMVSDPTVTHVAAFCDSVYAQKANERLAGVGAESQIISAEIYTRTKQTKFIPIVCEWTEAGEPCLPVFFKSLIWIDLSTLEKENENWERLLRTLYGQPAFKKPSLGAPPPYIVNPGSTAARSSLAKLRALENAIRQGKPVLGPYRRALLDECIRYADSLRIRERPDPETLPHKVYEDCRALAEVRDDLSSWVLLEAEASNRHDFVESLLELLERVYELTSHPVELKGGWRDDWAEAHEVFALDAFLHIIAALLKRKAYEVVHQVFHHHYSVPRSVAGGFGQFASFEIFRANAKYLQVVLAKDEQHLFSPAAEFIQKHIRNEEIPFASIMEADLLAFLVSLVVGCHWYPQTLVYHDYSSELRLFSRAARRRDFQAIATITGITSADELRRVVGAAYQRSGLEGDWAMRRLGLGQLLNIERWDTLS